MTAAELLARFPASRKNKPGDWHVPCPAHDDNVQRPEKFSLHITETIDRLLVTCLAGCSRERVLGALGLKDADLFFATNGSRPISTTTTAPRPTLATFAAKKHLDPALLVDAGWQENASGLLIPYRERDGSTWRMRIRRSLDAGQGFTWDSQKDRALIPYGRWRLDEALDQGELWLVEGESDTVTAWAHALPCLGLPGNQAAKALAAEDLAGIATLWIVEEPGQSGRGFLEKLRERLRELEYTGKAHVVRFAEKDLSDAHVAHGDALANQIWMAQLAARPLWEADPPVSEPPAEALPYLEPIAAFLAEEDPPTRFIFPELLPTDVLMLIHGEPRARKSLVGFELALSASTGTAPFGLAMYTPERAVPTLYVQEEDTRSLTRPRLRRLVRERCGATPPATLHVSVRRGIDLDDPVWVARLTEDLARLGIQFLVLDAARRLSAKVDEGPTKMRELIAVLRHLVTTTGVTIAVVHHDTKPPQVGNDMRRRSQRASGGDWFAACECPVHVERVGERESLVYPQDYKFSADPSPFTFTCVLDGRLIAKLEGSPTSSENAELAGARGKIVTWLRAHGPASKSDMKTAGLGRGDQLAALLDALLRSGAIDAVEGRKKGSLRYFVEGQSAPVPEAE